MKKIKKYFFIIKDLETLRVLADPLHHRIIELLIQEPLNVRQIAEKLGLMPSKLYYHISLLEKQGLIKVVETRQVANLIEKQYAAVSRYIDVDPELLAFNTQEGKVNVNSMLTGTIDATRDDILRSLEARAYELEHGAPEKPRNMVVTRLLARLPEKRAEEFARRLAKLMEDFDQADSGGSRAGEEIQPYALTVAYYPSFYYPEDEE